jgi:glutamate carboxypeptidase
MALTAQELAIRTAAERRAAALLDELAQHVAIPTGTGFATGIDEYRGMLLTRLEALGGTSELHPGSERPSWLRLPHAPPDEEAEAPVTAVVTRRTATQRPRILLAGHLDTVHDPHGAFRALALSADGGLATGPGAADMKGGILCAVSALEVLAEAGVDLPWTFLLNADEETGSFHSAEALAAQAALHSVGIALEPALPDGSLVIERMGTGQFQIVVHGRAAHVGRDFAQGASAVFALARLITRLESLVDLERGAIVNVGPLTGGLVTNAVPHLAACWGNVRFTDAAVQRELEAAVRSLATDDAAMPRVEVHTAFNRPMKPFTPEVRRLAEVIRGAAQDLGQAMPFGRTGGVCDGNILQAAGLPTLDTLGVRGGNLHRSDEYIEVASLVERTALLAIVLRRLWSEEIDPR